MSRNSGLPTESQVCRTLQSQKESWMQHKWWLQSADLKLPLLYNDLTLLHITHHSFSHCRGGKVRRSLVVQRFAKGDARVWALHEWKRFGVAWRLFDAPLRIIVSLISMKFFSLCLASLAPFYLWFKCNVIATQECMAGFSLMGLMVPCVILQILLLLSPLYVSLKGS